MIDFHSHLDLYPNPHEIIRECISRNLFVLSVTTTPSAWPRTSSLSQGAKRIRTALGLHPQIAHERITELPLFHKLLPEARYVGEIGLDGSREHQLHWRDQMTVFTTILKACAENGGRILSIHSRRAATQVLDVLEINRGAGIPILHWFSGSHRELSRAIKLGCWFSVGPAMLAGEKGRSLVEKIPIDRILTESDGPFAQIDGRAALPWDSENAVTSLIQLWSKPEIEVREILMSNLRKLVTPYSDITSKNFI